MEIVVGEANVEVSPDIAFYIMLANMPNFATIIQMLTEWAKPVKQLVKFVSTKGNSTSDQAAINVNDILTCDDAADKEIQIWRHFEAKQKHSRSKIERTNFKVWCFKNSINNICQSMKYGCKSTFEFDTADWKSFPLPNGAKRGQPATCAWNT